MKKRTLAILLIFSLLVILFLLFRKHNKIKEAISPQPRNGVALIITGAAARIPQEAALIEELDRRGLLRNLVFISGASSGALNSVVLNGILTGRLTWSEYKETLYHLRDSNIFVQQDKILPLNTSPARELYRSIIEDRLGYTEIGDLPFTTSISVTGLKDLDLKETVYRLSSRKLNKETDTTLNLVDVLMASSAFPVAFPPVKIRNVTTIPDVDYIDGGVGEDHVPYHALFEFERFRGAGVEKVYIISRKSDSIPEISEELRGIGINDKGLFDKMGISLDAILEKGIIKGLETYAAEAPDLVPLTYVWIPGFREDFPFFSFDSLEKQYVLTSKWAKTHEPIPIGDYLMHFH